MRRRVRSGFTLIELLVVVAIIALLVALLLPSLGHAKRLAIKTKCGAQLAGVGRAASTYFSDWSEMPYCQSRSYSSGWASNQLIYFRNDLAISLDGKKGNWNGIGLQLGQYLGGPKSPALVCPATLPTFNPFSLLTNAQLADPRSTSVWLYGNYMNFMSDVGNCVSQGQGARYFKDESRSTTYEGFTMGAHPNPPGARGGDISTTQELMQDLLWELDPSGSGTRVVQGNHLRSGGTLTGEVKTGSRLAAGYYTANKVDSFMGFNALMADYSVQWVVPNRARKVYCGTNSSDNLIYSNGPQ